MKVKLLKAWKEFQANNVVEVADEVGKSLIVAETAEAYDEAAVAKELAHQESIKKMVGEGVAQALKNVKTPALNLHVEVTEPEVKIYKSLGEQLIDVAQAKLTGQRSKRLQEYVSKAPAGYSEIVDADGGYLVQQDFMSEIFSAMIESDELASRCNSTEVSGDGLKWNEVNHYDRTKGAHPQSVAWVTEAGEITFDKAAFAPKELRLMKLGGGYKATSEILQDATALTAEVTNWFNQEFAFTISDAIVRGTGVGMPTGILNAPCLVTVTKHGARSSANLAFDLPNMFARMYPRGIPRAEWYIHNSILPYLMGMTVGTTPVYLPPNGYIGGPAGLLLGRPVNVLESCSEVGAVSDVMFCDFSQYKVIRKGGVRADSSIHVLFTSDQSAFRFIVRLNGMPMWSKVITPAHGTDTLSPFVVLGA